MKVIIVGGGFSGLFASLRLIKRGHQVTLFESRLIGQGSSSKNHGIIHSGGLYSRLHPQLVRDCKEAQQLFQISFPDQIVPGLESSIYFGLKEVMDSVISLWGNQEINFSSFSKEYVSAYFSDEIVGKSNFYQIPDESIMSSRGILVQLLNELLRSEKFKLFSRVHVKSLSISDSGHVNGVFDCSENFHHD